MKPTPAETEPRNWRVQKMTKGVATYTTKETMSEVEAVHFASVQNEMDRGRGVKWVAVQDEPVESEE